MGKEEIHVPRVVIKPSPAKPAARVVLRSTTKPKQLGETKSTSKVISAIKPKGVDSNGTVAGLDSIKKRKPRGTSNSSGTASLPNRPTPQGAQKSPDNVYSIREPKYVGELNYISNVGSHNKSKPLSVTKPSGSVGSASISKARSIRTTISATPKKAPWLAPTTTLSPPHPRKALAESSISLRMRNDQKFIERPAPRIRYSVAFLEALRPPPPPFIERLKSTTIAAVGPKLQIRYKIPALREPEILPTLEGQSQGAFSYDEKSGNELIRPSLTKVPISLRGVLLMPPISDDSNSKFSFRQRTIDEKQTSLARISRAASKKTDEEQLTAGGCSGMELQSTVPLSQIPPASGDSNTEKIQETSPDVVSSSPYWLVNRDFCHIQSDTEIITRRRSPVLAKYQSSDLPAEIHDFESKVRSALSYCGQQSCIDTSTSSMSVKWDPAVVYCSKATSDQPVTLPKQAMEAPQLIDSNPSKTLKLNYNFDNYLETVAELKKGDRRKLRLLLDALKDIDSDDDSDSNSNVVQECQKSKSDSNTVSKTQLNPRAPVFRDFSPLKKEGCPTDADLSWGLSSLDIPRKRPHIGIGDNICQEPIWVFPTATEDALYNPKAQPSRRQSRVHRRLPLINLKTGHIPSDTGSGRVAHAMHQVWADYLMRQFTTKYPLTGRLQASAPIPLQNRHATTLQQRLEYLLLEKKEKAALERLSETYNRKDSSV